MNTKLAALAKHAILQLKEDNKALKDELALHKRAYDLAFKMYELGAIEADGIQEKTAEFLEQTQQELDVLEKAAELSVSSDYTFGKLSERFEDNGNLDPLTSFLLNNEY